MAECPGGRNTRGPWSQFRLGMSGLTQGKGFHPIHLGDIMDSGQSSQTGALSSSPGKRTHTLTVREYEETIQELRTENFDLKLQLFMHEENLKKICHKDGSAPDKDPVEVIVKLNSETESLQNELRYKDKLLQDALERTKKYEIDFKELEQKNVKFQSELSSLSELPSKEEFLNLLEEKENLIKHVEFLETALTEKEQEINDLNQKIEIIAEQNFILEEKIKKRSLAIQGFVHKNYKEKELLPEELKNIVISATQAARNKSKDGLHLALKNITASLNQIMYSPAKITLNKSAEKENIKSPQAKCLKEEFLERSSVFLPCQNESSTELSHIQGLKEVLGERNTPKSKQFNNLASFVHGSCTERRAVGESGVNIAEKDVINHLNFSSVPSITEADLISFSGRLSPQSCSLIEHNPVTVKTLNADLIPKKETISKSDKKVLDRSSEESSQLVNLLKENENLKLELQEKLAVIRNLQATCMELSLRGTQLKETRTDALKASEQYSVYTQTNIAGNNLFDEMTKFEKDAQLSNNVDELREDVLLLLLAMDGKNKELIDVKQSLSDVKEDLKKALNATNSFDKDFYMHERNDLHERLAFSCSVNEELMRHLKGLEAFMENLLQNKLDSSIDSTKEKSDFIFHVSECLNKSLKLSNVLSDHLSVCEGSKLFEECESFVYKNGSYFDDKSLPHLNLSQLNIPEQDSLSYSGKLSQFQEACIPFMRKSDRKMNAESDGSQLCWRCWQQLNSPMSKPDISHPVHKYTIPNDMNYLSSESDIWSEPDRNISMQRIGISLQNSPVMSKSPRKQRLKDKRLSSRLSPDRETSSSGSQRFSKKRHGSASRRLFPKENVKNQDSISENFYFLLAEKYPKFKSLLIELQNAKDENTSSDVCMRLTAVVASIGRALQELHNARENAKNFPSAVCGKCVMLELFANLKLSLKETDFQTHVSVSEEEIFQEFVREIHLLKEECKEPLSLVLESIDKSDRLSEDIKTRDLENANIKLISRNKELTHNIDDLKSALSKEKKVLESLKNENSTLSSQINSLKEEMVNVKEKEKELSQKNEELVKELACVIETNSELNHTLKELKEKNKESNITLNQITTELQKSKSDLVKMNQKCLEYEKELNHQILQKEGYENQLKTVESTLLSEQKNYLRDIEKLKAEKTTHNKEKEEELSQKNEELVKELVNVNERNSELSRILKVLEEKNEEANITLSKITTELQNSRSDLVKMNKKCLEYEKELNQQILQKEEYENQLKTLESTLLSKQEKYLCQIEKLKVENSSHEKNMESIEEEKLHLKKENSNIKNKLENLNGELFSLQGSNKELQDANKALNTNCENAIEHAASLQKKYNSYKEKMSLELKEKEDEYHQQLKLQESKSLNEQKELLGQVAVLEKEKEEILQKLKKEKKCYEKLTKEKAEIQQKYDESCEQISSLKLLNDELRNKQSTLIQKKQFFENALHSSNNECDSLNEDLRCMRETLQNLESKCLLYEKQLTTAAGTKDNFVECILNINNEFSNQRQKLNNICKTYGNENYILSDETFVPVTEEDNVQELCEKMSSESKKLVQSVDMLLELLRHFHSKSSDTKTVKEKRDVSTQKQAQIHETEVEHWKSQYDHLQEVIDGLQKSVLEKEKSVQSSGHEIQSLKDKLYNSEKEIEKTNNLLKDKDDELTTLQERIFDLQTYLNSVISDKTSSFDQSSVTSSDFVSPNSQLPSQLSLKVSKTCQTSERDVRRQSTDDSFSSTSTLDSHWNSCCEKYYKKYHSLQKKLSLCNKRIELLEKEKNDLRESYLHQMQSKHESLGKTESVDAKLIELESKLEQKKAFINELKCELLKTCNSLIDKEKQVDDLKQKLSEYEAKSKLSTPDPSGRHSIVPLESVDSNIKTLRTYKWRLIQTLFDIQRQFYEKRGIHLNYLERFRDHVNNLYAVQLTQSLSKSESMPTLRSHAEELKNKVGDDRVKNLVNLELDIECLENLKIFLNRFFVPCVLDAPQMLDDKTSELKEEIIENEPRSLAVQTEAENLRHSKREIANISNIVFPNFLTTYESSNHQDASQERSFSFENFASNVSHHLDCIENFFTAVKKFQVLESFDISAQECTSKIEVKSLLLKIFQEIKARQLEIVTIFDLNSLLKKYDFVVAPPMQISSSKPDVSDRESVMSEETIAVSRCESPLSFEEVCPIKLPHPEMSRLQERTLKPESVGNRVSVVEPFGTKVTAIGSSCDSVCQRSHYSSPDLGIESDPNHDSSAPEQKEDSNQRYQKQFLEEQSFLSKSLQKTAFTSTDSAGRWSGHKFGDALYAIGNLPDYELLKKEVKESLVAIKSVLSRTGDGLHHIAKYTSPRKTLEYNTLKSIKDTCVHIEVCLRAANELVGKFWTAPCPSEREWKLLNDENQSLAEQLVNLKYMIQKQENEFKKAMGKLEHAQVVKANMEKKISKKLVKTKKVIRQAELKLLQNRCQNFPPVPKYPSDQSEQLLPE